MKKFVRFLLGNKYKILIKIYWQIKSLLFPIFRKRRGTLLYAGINVADSFQKIFYKYENVIGFEANPENYKKIKSYNNFQNVNIYNLALAKENKILDLNLPNNGNNNASASLSKFIFPDNNCKSVKSFKVKAVNLALFLEEKEIYNINTYISDIEGYDLTVLKTIKKDYLDKGRIKIIQVEAVSNKIKNPYNDVSNYEYEFDSLLKDNYLKCGRGSGFVKEGDTIDEDNTLDLLYKLK